MKLRCIPAVAALLAAASLNVSILADGAPTAKPADLRDLMTVSQFHRAGLDKLAPDELAALNSWFDANGSEQASTSGDLRDLMSVNQFHQAGLDKLTPDELTALNTTLAADRTQSNAASVSATAAPVAAPVAATQAAPASASSFGMEMVKSQRSQSPDQITTRIPGVFLGWNGNTVFRFENGQVWTQSGPGMFTTHLENAQVVIKKLAFGYLLTIQGQVETVFIRRIH